MDLDKIQEMWQKDAVIDPDNLHDESLKIPQLHSKYYTLYNTITLLRERAREQYNKVKLERHNFYTGKADPAVYKVREKDAIQRYLDADDRLNKVDMKIRYYDATLKFLEEIIKTVANRTFQIKNAIEWQKFQAGF